MMSGKIQLGEHTYKLPDVPDKSDIWFSDLPKKEQYWRRLPVPQLVYGYRRGITRANDEKTSWSSDRSHLLSLSYEDTQDLIRFRDEDLVRRKHGIWFMNNGEPTYITGGHYYFLQWVHLSGNKNRFTKEPFPMYMQFQRDCFYFMDLVWKDKKCIGGFIGKPKKTGITQLFAADILDRTTRTKNKEFGMMSVSEDKCRDTCYKYYLYGYDNLPDIISHPYSIRSKEEFKLAYPEVRGTTVEAVKRKMQAEESLNTHLFVAPTVADAFDSFLMYYAWIDEFPKLKNPYPKEVFDITKETVRQGGLRYGRLFLTSYVPEHDDDSFEQSKAIWEDSGLDTRNSLGETGSGMYRYFISAEDSYEEDDMLIDVYGKVDKEKVKRYLIQKDKELEKDYSKLQTFRRQYPRVENHMWESAGSTESKFDAVRLSKQINNIRSNMSGQLPYEEGNFMWENDLFYIGKGYGEGEFGRVKWVPLTRDQMLKGMTAPFRWYHPERYKHLKFNRVVDENIRDIRTGLYKPPGDLLFIGGVDPTEYVEEVNIGTGSKDGIIISTLPDKRLDAVNKMPVSGIPCIEYNYRHNNPDAFIEDLVKAILYLGGLFYIEGNKAWVMTTLKGHGLQNFFVMRNAKTKQLERYGQSPVDQQLYPTTQRTSTGAVNTVRDIIITLKRKLKEPEHAGDVDVIENIFMLDLLTQLLSFNPKDTKKFDLVMAYGFCEILAETIAGWELSNKRKNRPHGEALRNVLKAALKM